MLMEVIKKCTAEVSPAIPQMTSGGIVTPYKDIVFLIEVVLRPTMANYLNFLFLFSRFQQAFPVQAGRTGPDKNGKDKRAQDEKQIASGANWQSLYYVSVWDLVSMKIVRFISCSDSLESPPLQSFVRVLGGCGPSLWHLAISLPAHYPAHYSASG